jgi:importin subunit beta-1
VFWQDERFVDLWIHQAGDFKQNVKIAVIATLASPSKIVRSQIASLISAIAEIEIPRGEWSDLIASLCQNAQNDQMQIRLASLQTIGHICEDLHPNDLTSELKN